MWNDPIVEETRKHRDEYAALFNYDLKAMFLDLKGKEKQHRARVVSFDRADVLEKSRGEKKKESEQVLLP